MTRFEKPDLRLKVGVLLHDYYAWITSETVLILCFIRRAKTVRVIKTDIFICLLPPVLVTGVANCLEIVFLYELISRTSSK